MELIYDRPTNLSKSEALRLMSRFFAKEWKELKEEDISISRCQTGVNNEVYFVSRVAETGITEPNKVVIRKYNSMGREKERGDEDEWKKKAIAGMRATQIEQIIILKELARRGLGPQLLGIIDDGRIEEFIDCHKISFTEAHELEADIAVNMARIHATRVPLRKPSCLFGPVLREIHAEMMQEEIISYFQELGDETLISILVQHDYEPDFDMMDPFLDFDRNRMVLMNWDPHLDNIAVLNHPVRDGQLKTMIFDFEVAGYNMRGKDLGLFLVSRSGYFPICREDRRLESKDEFSPFLLAYQQEVVKELQEEADADGIDSLDHLMVESLIGGMVSCLFFMHFIANASAKKKGEGDFVQTAMQFIPSLFQGFMACKEALLDLVQHEQEKEKKDKKDRKDKTDRTAGLGGGEQRNRWLPHALRQSSGSN